MNVLLGICVFLCFTFLIMSVLRRKEEKEIRLVAMIEGVQAIEEEKPTPKWVQQIVAMFSRIFPSRLETIEKNLRHAGLASKMKAQDVVVWSVSSSLILIAISLATPMTLPGHVLLAVIFGFGGYLSPYFFRIWPYKTARQMDVRRQTRNFILMLTVLASTGIRFDQVLAQAIQGTNKSFRKVLDRMKDLTDSTWTIPEGFAWLAEETGVKELEFLSVVIAQSHKNGSKYDESLEEMMKTFDEEQENRIEILTQGIQVKVTIGVLGFLVLPLFFFWFVVQGASYFTSIQNGF